DEFELYLERFPQGLYVDLAKRRIAKLRGAPSTGDDSGMRGRNLDEELWRGVRDRADVADIEHYLDRFHQGLYVDLARRKVAKLRNRGGSRRVPRCSATQRRRGSARRTARRSVKRRKRRGSRPRRRRSARRRRKQGGRPRRRRSATRKTRRSARPRRKPARSRKQRPSARPKKRRSAKRRIVPGARPTHAASPRNGRNAMPRN